VKALQTRVKKIRTAIVDDEPLARRNIRLLLKDEPEIEIVGDACFSRQKLFRAS